MFIKRVEFAAAPIGDNLGIGGTEVIIPLKEHYYEKHDIFVVDKSHQQLYVTRRPIRKTDGYWEYYCVLLNNDGRQILDVTACQPGMKTHFLSNAHPFDYHDQLGPILKRFKIKHSLNCWELSMATETISSEGYLNITTFNDYRKCS